MKKVFYNISFLFLLMFSFTAYAQERNIRGRVTNEAGTGIAGASVVIKGTTTGTTTNNEGSFSITVPPGATLVISNIGYADREVIIGEQSEYQVSLVNTSRDISEVVVVGYGTQRRRDVTGSIVSVSETALREVPVANIQQALQGRAAGLEVQRVGNQPGAGAQIRIRGSRSISGSNEPLFVLDGIPYEGNLNDINPDDIASIEILKDASATAIYGSRGANGVILITTKKGKSGETRVSYNGYYGISKVANEYPVFNAEEYQAMRNLSTWGAGYMAEELNGITLGRNTNWQDLMYDNGLRTDHNITVYGGHAGSTFSLGGGYYKETAVLPGEEFTRYSVRGSIDSRVGRRFKVGLTTLNSLSLNYGSQFVSGSSMFRNLALSPLMPAYNDDGSLYLIPNGNIDDNNTDGRYSPLLLKQGDDTRWVDRVRRLRTINTLYGEVEFFTGLRYRINLGLNYAQQHAAQFQGSDKPNDPSFFRAARGNTARVENGETWGYTVENLLYYDKTIASKHRIGVTALYSIQETQSFSNFVQKDSITEDFVQFYNLALSTPITSQNTSLGGSETRSSIISYMGRINYAFDDRFLLTLTGRIDGSSRLAAGNKWFTYPAISAGWNMTNESFIRNIKSLSNLKLRVGWGKTSNQSINPYASLGLVSNTNGLTAGSTGGNIIRYNYGPTIVTGFQVINLPNPNLEWEFSKTINVGLDFGLFNNRITGAIEYYKQKTDNILYEVALPVTSGVAGPYTTNVGEMENKGFEFSVSSLNIQSKNGFEWSTDLNLFFNRNKILKLSSDIVRDIGNQLHVGYPMSAIFDFKKIGIWQINEAAQALVYGATPGQIKLLDYSGPEGKPDNLITDTHDQFVIGDGDAKLQGGMTNRFSYKGVDLSIVMYARFGGLLISQIHQPPASFLTVMDGRRNGVKVDYWTQTNPSNWFPSPAAISANGTPGINPRSDAWKTLGYYDATFVKIRSINLGYNFQRSILKRLNAQNLRLYITVDNVATIFSPYFNKTGIDPEGTDVGNRGVGNSVGNIRTNTRGNGTIVVTAATPLRRTFSIGANITL